MSSLSESTASPHELIEALQSQVAALAGELKRISIERDYFKEQLAARMRQLFAAKSEARGLGKL